MTRACPPAMPGLPTSPRSPACTSSQLVACSTAHQASAGQPTATGAAAQCACLRRLRSGGGSAQLLAEVIELRAQLGEPTLDLHLGECGHGECGRTACSHSGSHATVGLVPRGRTQRSKSNERSARCTCAVPPCAAAPPRSALSRAPCARTPPRACRARARAASPASMHAHVPGTPWAWARLLRLQHSALCTLHSAPCTLHPALRARACCCSGAVLSSRRRCEASSTAKGTWDGCAAAAAAAAAALGPCG